MADAVARLTPISVVGGGTQSGFGRPMQTAASLSVSALTGVTLYEPAELVVSARSGTPLADVEALLAANRQRLAFEPGDRRSLYGSEGAPTIGAVAATNASGPRRIQAGAARDSLIGVRAVNGSGEVFKSGGRVMKNVTGYDLVKFMAGSFGTLAVLSEVTFKVLPVPEVETTLMFEGLVAAKAMQLLSAALGSPFGITGAAHIPDPSPRTLVRIDGFAASVDERAGRLRKLLAAFGDAASLSHADSGRLWQSVRDLDVLAADKDEPIWRVSVRPGDGAAVADAIGAGFDAHFLFDWGGGLVWVAGGAGEDAGASVIRAAVSAVGGHATLVRAPDAVRHSVDVFEPRSPALIDLHRRLKAAFDPAGTLNPGRMYRGH